MMLEVAIVVSTIRNCSSKIFTMKIFQGHAQVLSAHIISAQIASAHLQNSLCREQIITATKFIMLKIESGIICTVKKCIGNKYSGNKLCQIQLVPENFLSGVVKNSVQKRQIYLHRQMNFRRKPTSLTITVGR